VYHEPSPSLSIRCYAVMLLLSLAGCVADHPGLAWPNCNRFHVA
jgi:hypothetical protein